jgi:hypothetical protein
MYGLHDEQVRISATEYSCSSVRLLLSSSDLLVSGEKNAYVPSP